MPRSWDTRQDETARAQGADTPNVAELQKAVDRMGQWSVDDVLSELGGSGRGRSTRLATKLLEARGMEVNKKSIASQMKSLQRWTRYEHGERSKDVRAPSKESQKILNHIGRNAQAARDGFNVTMSGDISIEHYRRGDRNAYVHMQGDAALAFLDNPTFAGLSGSDNYGGLAIEAFGDVQISIDL